MRDDDAHRRRPTEREREGWGSVSTPSEHVDVLIVGAGISGIGAAHHLKDQRPGTSFLLLDALPSFGGTWWTHRYPGVRSDSDLFTLSIQLGHALGRQYLGQQIAIDFVQRFL